MRGSVAAPSSLVLLPGTLLATVALHNRCKSQYEVTSAQCSDRFGCRNPLNILDSAWYQNQRKKRPSYVVAASPDEKIGRYLYTTECDSASTASDLTGQRRHEYTSCDCTGNPCWRGFGTFGDGSLLSSLCLLAACKQGANISLGAFLIILHLP